LNGRASLLEKLDSARRTMERQTSEVFFDRNHTLARSVLTSGKLANAHDVKREPAK